MAEGLSQSTVYALARDARGFLWAGTHDGLNRFDGHAFVAYRHEPDDPKTLSHDRITALVPEGDGDLWVLTSTGLDRLDPRTGHFVRYGLATGAPGETATVLVPRRQGGYWVGTNSGLYRFDPERGRFSAAARSAIVLAVAETPDGVVWAGTEAGLRVVEEGAFVRPVGVPPALAERHVRALLPGRDGRLWVGTDEGLFVRDAGGGFRIVPLGHRVSALAEDATGHLWAGTAQGGLSVVDPGTEAARRLPVEGMAANVQAVWVDPVGSIWVGTDGAGVLRLDLRAPKFERVVLGPRGEQDVFVRSILADVEGGIWVGTTDGLRHRDGANGRWRVFRHRPGAVRSLPHDDIRAVLRDRAGTLWVGTADGLSEWDGREGFSRYTLPGSYPEAQIITRLLETRDGTLWVAARSGVFRRVADGSFTPLGLHDRGVQRTFTLDTRALAEDGVGGLWLGDYNGNLYRYDPANPARSVDVATRVILNSTITSLAVDRRDRLWVGTQRGLVRLDTESGARRRFDERDGLPSAFVYFLLEDEEGHVWVGTNRGLVRFDPDQEEPRFRAYGPADGLQSNEFNSNATFRASDGTLYAGGIAGLNAFTLVSVRDDPTPPPVAFTGFKRFDEPVPLSVDLNAAKTLRLDWQRDAVFSFEFAGLDLTDPARVRYRYRMEGVDPGWVEAGHRREARYTNLAPGTYTFHVTAANADGAWNPKGRALTVSIPPPWWRTGWFALLFGLAFVGVVGGGVRAVAGRKLRRQLRALEAERALDHAVHEERARISADVHDHVGATLTQIQLLSEVARRSRNGRGIESLDRIAGAARTATAELDAIVWAINPAQDHLDAFADYLCAYAGDYCESVGLRSRFERPTAWPEGRLPAEVRHPAFVVVKEALCNAARHAHAETVYLRFLSGEAEVAVEVEDDGVGFDVQAVGAFSNGLRTMRARAESAGGRLEVESEAGQGTRVRIVLPLQAEVEAGG